MFYFNKSFVSNFGNHSYTLRMEGNLQVINKNLEKLFKAEDNCLDAKSFVDEQGSLMTDSSEIIAHMEEKGYIENDEGKYFLAEKGFIVYESGGLKEKMKEREALDPLYDKEVAKIFRIPNLKAKVFAFLFLIALVIAAQKFLNPTEEKVEDVKTEISSESKE